MALTYIDANVLVYAMHPFEHPKQAAARRLLTSLCKVEQAVTCALTIDEVVWAVRKEAGSGVALAVGRRALTMPGLEYAPVRRREMAHALDLMAAHRLDPRDAVHAAVALEVGCTRIASDDPDLDGVAGLKRVGI